MQIEGAERQTLEDRVLAAVGRAWARGRRGVARRRSTGRASGGKVCEAEEKVDARTGVGWPLGSRAL